MRTRFHGVSWGLLVSASLILGATIPSRAAECRTISTVQNSAIAANNTAAGGHLTGHIRGETPPAGWNYTNKSLFTSASEYSGAWKNYVANTTIAPVNCAGNQAQQKVSVQTLLKKPVIGAISCHNADCSESNKTQFSYIFFGFVLNGSNWILNTAFPSN